MSEPEWVEKSTLLLLVNDSLSEHGGAPGLRDEGLLASALARPINRHGYEGETNIASLAACYGFGIAKNHPFIDGNKRAALIALGLFLKLNGFNLRAPQIDTFQTILKLAAGSLEEVELADWLTAQIAPR